MSQPQPRRLHVLALDGRSLCDQFSNAEFGEPESNEDCPPCGACVFVAELYVGLADQLIRQGGTPTPDPVEALQLLRRTRWGVHLDIDAVEQDTAADEYQYPQPGRAALVLNSHASEDQ